MTLSERERRHHALLAHIVAAHAPTLWREVSPTLLRYVVAITKELEPELSITVLARAKEVNINFLESIIEKFKRTVPQPKLNSFISTLSKGIGSTFGFSTIDPRYLQLESYLRPMLEQTLSEYWNNLTSSRTLAKNIADLAESGNSFKDIIKGVQNRYRTGYYTAERIVRTNMNAASNYKGTQDLLEAGFEKQAWRTSQDSRVRGGPGRPRDRFNHWDMDAQVVRIEAPFFTPEGYKLLFPGDPSLGAPIGTRANCRCFVTGVR